MIKRYYLDSGLDPCNSCVFTEDENGEWVRWDDVEADSVLGIFPKETADAGADAEIDALIEERVAARKNRDFARADAIRDDLAGEGIILEDTPHGTVWHRD